MGNLKDPGIFYLLRGIRFLHQRFLLSQGWAERFHLPGGEQHKVKEMGCCGGEPGPAAALLPGARRLWGGSETSSLVCFFFLFFFRKKAWCIPPALSVLPSKSKRFCLLMRC